MDIRTTQPCSGRFTQSLDTEIARSLDELWRAEYEVRSLHDPGPRAGVMGRGEYVDVRYVIRGKARLRNGLQDDLFSLLRAREDVQPHILRLLESVQVRRDPTLEPPGIPFGDDEVETPRVRQLAGLTFTEKGLDVS